MRIATVVAIVAAGLTAGSMLGAPAANASGDAPWCAVTQLGEGAMAWNCEYETVEECLPSVSSGNRGSCVPNPYAAPAPVSAPAPCVCSRPCGCSHHCSEKHHAQRDAEPQSPGERKIMRTASKLVVAATDLAASSMLGAPSAYASGDAPWCAGHTGRGRRRDLVAKCLCTRNLTSVGSILFCLGKVRIQKRVNLTLEVSSLVIVYVD